MRLPEAVAGARILAFGGYQPDNVVTNDDLSPRSWTPTTNGSRAASASPAPLIAGPDETVVDMAVAAARQGARRQRGQPVRHRPGHRGDLQHAERRSRTRPRQWPAGSASTRPAPTTSTRPAPGFCYALANASDAIRSRAGPQRAGRRRRRSCRPGWTRRTARRGIIFADGAGAAVVGPADPRTSRASARWCGAAPATIADTIVINDRQLVPVPGGPGRVPLGHHRAVPGRARGLRAGRGRRPASWPRSSRTRPTCASSRRSPAARGAATPRRPRHRHARATPRRPRSRWRCRGWSSAARSPSGAPVLLLGFGSGLAYAGQVVAGPLSRLCAQPVPHLAASNQPREKQAPWH